MLCPNCNQPIRPGAGFCGKCGYRLNADQYTAPDMSLNQKICPDCGSPCEPDAMFCRNCGHHFEADGPYADPYKDPYTESYEDLYTESYENPYTEPYEDPYADPYGPTDVGGGRKKKSGPWKVLAGILGGVVIAALLVVGLHVTGVISLPLPFGDKEAAVESTAVDTQETASEQGSEQAGASTEAADAAGATTESLPSAGTTSDGIGEAEEGSADNTITELTDGLGAESITYPTEVSDFISCNDPDGVYSFFYPKNFFKSGTYDPTAKGFSFETADKTQTLTITVEDAPVRNDPKASAQQKLAGVKSWFDTSAKAMYYHSSPKVSDSGFYREIITGPNSTQEGLGRYLIFAANSEKVYTLSYTYSRESGNEELEQKLNYVTQMLYRGWSIGGSDKPLRSYESYKADPEDTGGDK